MSSLGTYAVWHALHSRRTERALPSPRSVPRSRCRRPRRGGDRRVARGPRPRPPARRPRRAARRLGGVPAGERQAVAAAARPRGRRPAAPGGAAADGRSGGTQRLPHGSAPPGERGPRTAPTEPDPPHRPRDVDLHAALRLAHAVLPDALREHRASRAGPAGTCLCRLRLPRRLAAVRAGRRAARGRDGGGGPVVRGRDDRRLARDGCRAPRRPCRGGVVGLPGRRQHGGGRRTLPARLERSGVRGSGARHRGADVPGVAASPPHPHRVRVARPDRDLRRALAPERPGARGVAGGAAPPRSPSRLPRPTGVRRDERGHDRAVRPRPGVAGAQLTHRQPRLPAAVRLRGARRGRAAAGQRDAGAGQPVAAARGRARARRLRRVTAGRRERRRGLPPGPGRAGLRRRRVRVALHPQPVVVLSGEDGFRRRRGLPRLPPRPRRRGAAARVRGTDSGPWTWRSSPHSPVSPWSTSSSRISIGSGRRLCSESCSGISPCGPRARGRALPPFVLRSRPGCLRAP